VDHRTFYSCQPHSCPGINVVADQIHFH